MGGLSLAALGAAAIDLAQEVGKIIVRCFVLFAIIAVLWPLLPEDPFRAELLSFASALAPYYHWIDLVIPVGLVVKATAFWAAWRYAYAVYRRVSKAALGDSSATLST